MITPAGLLRHLRHRRPVITAPLDPGRRCAGRGVGRVTRDDLVRLALSVMTLAGLLLTAAALGDLRHLRCMLFAGLTLTVVAGLAVLRVQLRTRREVADESPQGVVDINSAPSVAANSAQIAQLRADFALLESRVDCHALHVRAIWQAMRRVVDDPDIPDEVAPLRVANPVRKEGSGSLCSAAGTSLTFVSGSV